ncbi:uncharacterized protein LOC115626397 [Scaptodrosophila lebanonensis]|uniref:Uncharacterized protein LOC115626397 n=1 Tax=Drosophila lebanonensis TaxID=7225 RepID=A0A6J2TQ30_DROLE|nr:uncharacterized protein LOC115626397 [Scaptodrosophila lebanonensis]
MRSRTELVTTTFVDSDDEDYSEDDDSEEDWRPTKKKQQKQTRGDGGGRKRKAAPAAANKAKRRASKVSGDDFDTADEYDLDSEPSEDEFEDAIEYAAASTSTKRSQSLPPKKQFVKLSQLDLLLNKRDLLAQDWLQNSRLCLWRKDEDTNLLQKYLRVKATAANMDGDAAEDGEQLLFTSSSVYSSWDEQHISDFINVKVNCLDPNNRRIKLDDLPALKKLADELRSTKENKPAAENTDENDNEDETTSQQLANESLNEEPTALEEQPEDDEQETDNEDDEDEED